MVAVLVLAGVQLVLVGLIGEYLGRMFLAVNRKPQYLVREVFHRAPGEGTAGIEVERPPDTRPPVSRIVNLPRGNPAMTIYYVALAIGILAGIGGQVLLEDGADAPDFVSQGAAAVDT